MSVPAPSTPLPNQQPLCSSECLLLRTCTVSKVKPKLALPACSALRSLVRDTSWCLLLHFLLAPWASKTSVTSLSPLVTYHTPNSGPLQWPLLCVANSPAPRCSQAPFSLHSGLPGDIARWEQSSLTTKSRLAHFIIFHFFILL